MTRHEALVGLAILVWMLCVALIAVTSNAGVMLLAFLGAAVSGTVAVLMAR